MSDRSQPHVVVLGGGNGTSRVLRALVPLLRDGELASLHALVQMADDGGSTGRLRAQYAVGSMGDLTKCLMALSNLWGDVRGEELLRALDYRFERGDFKGHTLRNILLTVFELTSHDIDSALAILARLVQIPKAAGVIPTTLKAVTQQVVVESDGKRRVLGEGQHFISWSVDMQGNPAWRPGDVRVMFKEGSVPLNPRAADALAAATHIIVAPGHTYGSVLPVLALPALGEVLQGSSAALMTVMTLLTTPRHTVGWTGEDFVAVYESYIGRPFDVVVANTGVVPLALVSGQEWVHFTEVPHEYRLVQADVVGSERHAQQKGDAVPRPVVVHDSDKLREVLRPLLA